MHALAWLHQVAGLPAVGPIAYSRGMAAGGQKLPRWLCKGCTGNSFVGYYAGGYIIQPVLCLSICVL